jgi:Uma2 family endonuclease
MTLQEYFGTPETTLPQELIYGAMRVAESPTATHQELVGRLFLTLHPHVRAQGLGSVWLAPLDVVLDATRALVVQPDLVVVRHDGRARVFEKIYGPPDLAIEVLSPRPRIGDVSERLAWFRDYGVRECWLVHQLERRIEVLQFDEGRTASRRAFERHEPLVSAVLPAWATPPAEFFGY